MIGATFEDDEAYPIPFDDRTGRDPNDPALPSTRERIAAFQRSPVGIMQDMYRPKTWRDLDREAIMEKHGGTNIHGMALPPPSQGEPKAWRDVVIGETPADALFNLGLGGTGRLAKGALALGGLFKMADPAEAAPKFARGVPPWLTHPDQWWQGFSSNKLTKPMSEMFSEHVPSPTQVVRERFVSPEWFQGRGAFLPAPGDKAMAGERLVGVGGQRLDVPVELQGGHGFMAAQNPYVWASDQGVISTLAGRSRNLAERYPNVFLPYTGMGGQSVDFSHHMSDTLSEMVKNAQIIKRSKDPERMTAETFDTAMRNPITEGKGEKEKVVYRALEDWPGVLDPNLRQYLADAPGKMRDKFAKVMATTPYQRGGFPNVAEARLAVSDPRLLYDTPLASGISIARVDPNVIGPSGHRTYSTGIGGEYVGGFGQSIPATIMYPDIFKAYAAGKPLSPSQLDYAFRAGKPPFYQEANQEWLDGVMQYLGALRNAR